MRVPSAIDLFCKGHRIAVTGVSRDGRLPANAILRRLRETGFDVVAVNPKATVVEGLRAYPDIASIEGLVDGVLIASPPASGPYIVQQCIDRGIRSIWFHRSMGQGSVDDAAVELCWVHGVEPIVGGCPLMFIGRIDPVHACMRWFLQHTGNVPK